MIENTFCLPLIQSPRSFSCDSLFSLQQEKTPFILTKYSWPTRWPSAVRPPPRSFLWRVQSGLGLARAVVRRVMSPKADAKLEENFMLWYSRGLGRDVIFVPSWWIDKTVRKERQGGLSAQYTQSVVGQEWALFVEHGVKKLGGDQCYHRKSFKRLFKSMIGWCYHVWSLDFGGPLVGSKFCFAANQLSAELSRLALLDHWKLRNQFSRELSS